MHDLFKLIIFIAGADEGNAVHKGPNLVGGHYDGPFPDEAF